MLSLAEDVFGKFVDLFHGDGFYVRNAFPLLVQPFRLGLGVFQQGCPVTVVALGAVHGVKNGITGTVQFLLGDISLAEVVRNSGDGAAHSLLIAHDAGTHRDDIAVVRIGFTDIEAGGRGVGFPHVFAQALEYAVIENCLEHVQPAGQLFIFSAGRFPEKADHRFINGGVIGQVLGEIEVRHGRMAKRFIQRCRSFRTFGNCAYGAFQQGDDVFRPEVSRNGHFHVVVFQRGIHPVPHVLDLVGGKLFLSGEGEPGIVPVKDGRYLLLHGSLHFMVHLVINHGNGPPEQGNAVLAVTGVHQVGRLELELRFQVFPVGVSGKQEEAVRHGEAYPYLLACHDGGQFVIGVVFQTAAVHDGIRKKFQPGGFFRPAQFPAVHGKGDVDGVLVKFRGLQVDAHAVGQGELGDSQVGGFRTGRHLAGIPELIGKILAAVRLVGLYFSGLGFPVRVHDFGASLGVFLIGSDDHAGKGSGPGFLQGCLALFGRQVFHNFPGDGPVFLRRGEDLVPCGALGDGGSQVFRLGGSPGLDGVFRGGGNVAAGLRQFFLVEAEFDGPAQFLFNGGQSRFPILVVRLGLNGIHFRRFHYVHAASFRGDKGAVRILRHLFQTAVQHGVSHVQGDIFVAVGDGIRLFHIGPGDVDAGFRAGGLFVGNPVGGGFRSRFKRAPVRLEGVVVLLHGAKILFHPGFSLFRCDVPGDDELHLAGYVVSPIIVDKFFPRRGADYFQRADGIAVGNAGSVQHDGEDFLHDPVTGGVTHLVFAGDDAAFRVNGAFFQQGSVRKIPHDGESQVHGGFLHAGHVHHVHGFVKGGVRICVPSQAQAFFLHGGNHFPALEMGASVENHVFQEVGNALDVIRFIQGTRVDAQADAEPALGFRIRADEVGQAVGELPLDKLGVLLGNACRRLHWGSLNLVFCCSSGRRIGRK